MDGGRRAFAILLLLALVGFASCYFNGAENSLYTLDGLGPTAGAARQVPVESQPRQERGQVLRTPRSTEDEVDDGELVQVRDITAERVISPCSCRPNNAVAVCRPRQLSLCDDVLPYNSTLLPNLVGDRDRVSLDRTLLFFALMLKTECNPRLKQLLCSLLEPPCRGGRTLLPCRKFCKVATENCQKLIPATLASATCLRQEHQCPDLTCIPKQWRCDGVRDCPLAADEANCTGRGASKVCSHEEFRCDFRCIPNTWRCDGEPDCQDAADERHCPPKPVCGTGRFQCRDGSGCFPQRWVCDGKAECRDGSDEQDCTNRKCTAGDFRCDNGICVPSLWRCDGHNDCRDGSDERHCGTYVKVNGRPSTKH
ncbi:hypothetical protein MRX96_016284 [Rhipicephalus microplus]